MDTNEKPFTVSVLESGTVVASFASYDDAIEFALTYPTDAPDHLQGAIALSISFFNAPVDPISGFTDDPILDAIIEGY